MGYVVICSVRLLLPHMTTGAYCYHNISWMAALQKTRRGRQMSQRLRALVLLVNQHLIPQRTCLPIRLL
jgi:hypothetical protein